MIVFGAILMILSVVLHIPLFWTLGIILVLVGVVLWIAGAMGHAIGPRARYW